MIINLIQDLPTPHNNLLIKKLIDKKLKINLWYASNANDDLYGWKEDLANQHVKSRIYGKKLNILFLIKCLFSFNQKFILVGWQNINTKFLHVLFFIFRKKYNHWTDLPYLKFESKKKIFLRKITDCILYYSNCIIICTGKVTINYFLNKQFNDDKLFNLPVLFEKKKKGYLKNKYLRLNQLKSLIHYDDFIISSGSRLVYEKGFDLSIKAVSRLINDYNFKNIKYIICGKGPERNKLNKMIISKKLKKNIFLINWLSYDEFIDLISISDIFLHPARFDAYGPVVISSSLGIPTIASKYCGSAKEIINNNINGIFYNPFNLKQLSDIIVKIYKSKKERVKLSNFSKIYSLKTDNSMIVNNMISKII
jgi:glycosyltransferase involved in cell wall biosynthesis